MSVGAEAAPQRQLTLPAGEVSLSLRDVPVVYVSILLDTRRQVRFDPLRAFALSNLRTIAFSQRRSIHFALSSFAAFAASRETFLSIVEGRSA